MESGMIKFHGSRGFILVVVLIITAVGLLFGAGALLLFQHQCRLRIDRQHEFEKVYAVRSALNYIRTHMGAELINAEFGYHTASGRDLPVIVRPVENVFPNRTNAHHLAMSSRTEESRRFTDVSLNTHPMGYCNFDLDYECGMVGATNLIIKSYSQLPYGLDFTEQMATNGARSWVNIGMSGTESWVKEEYGRRYWFQRYTTGTPTQDIVRLCLIRNISHLKDSRNIPLSEGFRRGWPLSQNGERALVFELCPLKNNNGIGMTITEYEHKDGVDIPTPLPIAITNVEYLCYMGFQLARNQISLFYISNKGTGSDESHGYVFSDAVSLTSKTYDYFTNKVSFSDGTFDEGVRMDESGRVLKAPELRAVLEVEPVFIKQKGDKEVLADFRVSPAYQYDVFLEHPKDMLKRATVAQKIGIYDDRNGKKSSNYTVLTYDTHGTENKGFRYDERHPNGE